MGQRTPEEGFGKGWLSVAGEEPLPDNPTVPEPDERRDTQAGFIYGRSDALERFTPSLFPTPVAHFGTTEH